MKKFRFFLKNVAMIVASFAVALCATMMGCNKDKPQTAGEITVNLRTDIKPASSLKVANDQWETNDKVGLFMKRAGQALIASGAVYAEADNVQTSVEGGMLTADPPVMYPRVGNVDFIA